MKLLLDVQCLRNRNPRTGIERYAMELSKAIVRNSGDHELWITTGPHAADTAERIFGKYIPGSRMVRLALPVPAPESTSVTKLRARAAEWMREAFIADLAPDVVHLTSLIWDDAVTSINAFESGPITAVTHYDLIPLLHPEHYLAADWERESYQRKIRSLSNADLLLSISEYAKQEAVNVLGIQADRIVVIPGAADTQFRPAQHDPELKNLLHTRYGIGKAFLLCVNIGDYRKNTHRLIRAFGLLPRQIRANRQLVIVGPITEQLRGDLQSTANSMGVPSGELIITGFVPDSDLRLLYSFCELFIMPSLHEGLGLPVLEAMACGAPVVGSDASSIPEILGRSDAVFDPRNVEAIAAKIHDALSRPGFMRSLREWSGLQSGRFSWDRSGKLAWDAFLRLHRAPRSNSRPAPANGRRKERLNYVISASLSDRPSSAGFVEFLRQLSRYYDLEVITASFDTDLSTEFACRDLDQFEADADAADRIVYDASGQFVTFQLQRLMEERPGVVILRDLAFAEWLYRAEAPNRGKWLRALYLEDGIAAVRSFVRTLDPARYPCVRRLIQTSTGTIVCTEEVFAVLRHYLGAKLIDQVKVLHQLQTVSWEVCNGKDGVEKLAEHFHERLERFFRSHPNARLNRLIDRIGSHSGQLSEDDLRTVAECITANGTFRQPRLLVDAGLLMHAPLGGVSRATRNIVDQLTREPKPGVRIEPVRRDGPSFHTCSGCWRKLGAPDFGWTDSAVYPVRTDRVLLLELGIAADAIAMLKRRQVATYLVLFDILPIRRPDFFVEGMGLSFERLLRAAAADIDGILCISRTVADDLNNWLFEERIPRKTPLQIGWFHLGADLPSADNAEPPEDSRAMLGAALTQSFALMVGSLEYRSDRKGYGQALDAFELLWGRGYDVGLAVVGQRVSPSDDLTERITGHAEFGRRLFWFERAPDGILTTLYKSATVLLYPSHGEGFGLPLVEAAWYNLPVIARDLPIFREIAGEHIVYFDGYGGSDFATAIEAFFAMRNQGSVPPSSAMKPLTWAQSAEDLLSVILGGDWYATYGPYE
jgi:glycosyltransferase involved in cell wall biosynthesis